MHHVDLLEEKLVADGGKGGEQVVVIEMDTDDLVALYEPQITLRIRVWSVTCSPRSERSLAIFFKCLQ